MKHKLLITAFFVTGFIILGTIAAPTVIADSYSWQITGSTSFVHSYHTYEYCDKLEASSCSASNVNTVEYCQDSPDESPCPDPSNLAYCNIGAHQETCLDTTTPAPTACTSAPNACGQTNSGSQPYGGICSASTPANPSFYGAACTSAANSCGMTNPGTLSCSDTCSAGAPSNSLCPAPPPPLPDLTVNPLPNLTGTAGQSVTFTGTVVNIGNGSANAQFEDVFLPYNQSGNGDIDKINNPLGPGASSALKSATFTYPTAGTYTYAFCADWSGVIVESNEGNNCQTATVTVNPPIPAAPTNPQTTCSAAGNSVSISWSPSQYATVYYPRFYHVTAAQCPAGWQEYSDGATCYPNPDNFNGTSISNFPVNPGQGYSWYVLSANSSGSTNDAASANFTCNAPVVNHAPTSGFDGLNGCTYASGWTFDQDSEPVSRRGYLYRRSVCQSNSLKYLSSRCSKCLRTTYE
jgi:hypothetical protein